MRTFVDIDEYILRPRADRTSHLRLDEPCTLIGGTNSSHFRGLLAHTLGTTIPSGKKIVLCHACNTHLCSNPNHLYWGTARENFEDTRANGKYTSVHELTRRKYGECAQREMLSTAGSKGGRAERKAPLG